MKFKDLIADCLLCLLFISIFPILSFMYWITLNKDKEIWDNKKCVD